jgi:hypothetical protein
MDGLVTMAGGLHLPYLLVTSIHTPEAPPTSHSDAYELGEKFIKITTREANIIADICFDLIAIYLFNVNPLRYFVWVMSSATNVEPQTLVALELEPRRKR